MPRFRAKPIVVDAVRWKGAIAAIDQLPDPSATLIYIPGEPLYIIMDERLRKVDLGDWVIRDAKGELYPCKPEVFNDLYEPAED